MYEIGEMTSLKSLRGMEPERSIVVIGQTLYLLPNQDNLLSPSGRLLISKLRTAEVNDCCFSAGLLFWFC